MPLLHSQARSKVGFTTENPTKSTLSHLREAFQTFLEAPCRIYPEREENTVMFIVQRIWLCFTRNMCPQTSVVNEKEMKEKNWRERQ